MLALAGVTVIDSRAAEVTVSCAEPLTAPAVAVIVVWPAPRLFATPVELMVATDADEDVQLTDAVRFCVVPSLNVPVAVKD
jgi:hypothetical protein